MTRRLMVVDDEWAYRITLQEIFIQEGWEVISAEDGPGAIQIASESRIDLIFMDMHMKSMSGIDTCSAIKEILPDCVIVMVTGYFDDALVQRALSQGAMTVLAKPVSIEQLLEISNQVDYVSPS